MKGLNINGLKNSRIHDTFVDLKKQKTCALICYVVAGYPTIQMSEKIITTLIESGVDIIEIGIPFSDPIADGPVIQSASYQSLTNGTTPEMCIKLCSRLRKKFPKTPILFMTYANILYGTGMKKFLTMSKKSGADGFILPDIPVDESADYIKLASELDLSTIFLVSPNISNDRLSSIISKTTGFIYLVSVFGTTGERKQFEEYTIKKIKEVKKYVRGRLPVAVGFGIGTLEHVRTIVAAGADGIIIGSKIIKIIKDGKNQKEILTNLEGFIKHIKIGCKI